MATCHSGSDGVGELRGGGLRGTESRGVATQPMNSSAARSNFAGWRRSRSNAVLACDRDTQILYTAGITVVSSNAVITIPPAQRRPALATQLPRGGCFCLQVLRDLAYAVNEEATATADSASAGAPR